MTSDSKLGSSQTQRSTITRLLRNDLVVDVDHARLAIVIGLANGQVLGTFDLEHSKTLRGLLEEAEDICTYRVPAYPAPEPKKAK